MNTSREFCSDGWLARAALLLVPGLALGGCFLAPGSPQRPAAATVSGPAPYVEDCQTCHRTPVAANYAQSLHAAKGLRCGQCHTPDGHPDFARPVADGTCGGCHQPQYQQTLDSTHFATREARQLDNDRAARVALRRERFIASTPAGRVFVGDSSAGDLGGRLCVACHYDEHRLGLAAVRAVNFCTGCHAGREDHYPTATPDSSNRCIACHVRVGQTVSGQIVDSHGFVAPGTQGTKN